MRILCVGDVFGRPGRHACQSLLPQLVKEKKIDFVLVNVDNAAGGKGLTPKVADELSDLPIHVMTGGNHIWEKESIFPYLQSKPIVRPYNIVGTVAGRGYQIINTVEGLNVGVIHLQGKVFMEGKGHQVYSPFRGADTVIEKIKERCSIILVDIHAEATAEKKALAWYLDGRVSAVVGTHTHIQTADAMILPEGTAYITDLGMTGAHHSVIGMDVDAALMRFLSEGKNKKFRIAKEDVRLEGVVIEVNENTGQALAIESVRQVIEAS